MQITDNGIVKLLPRFNCAVKKRTLVNWRQHHLLPKPRARGRGQGKGKVYFYTDLTVVRQTCVVKQLRNSVGRLDQLYVPLWLLGYEVDYRLVRRQMTGYVRKLLKDMTRGAKSLSVVHLEDHLTPLLDRYWTIVQNDTSRDEYSADATTAYFSLDRVICALVALLAPKIALADLSPADEEERAELILKFQAKWHGRHITMEEATQLASDFTSQLRGLREYVSPHTLLPAMRTAKKGDWIRTQSLIRNFARCSWAIYKAYKANPPDPYGPSERVQCGKDLLHFGRISIAIGLRLVQRVDSDIIENIIDKVSREVIQARRERGTRANSDDLRSLHYN